MKCSICDEEASFSIPKYRGAKNKMVESYEYRCVKHIKLNRGVERKLSMAKNKGYLEREIKKMFPKDVLISKPTDVIKDVSKPSE